MDRKLDIKAIVSDGRNYLLSGLVFIAVGLSISKPLMSLGLISIGFSWVVEKGIKLKFERFKSNRIAIILCSLYAISLLGLIHTSNYEYGLDDIRKKLPLLLVPLFLAGHSHLTTKEFLFILKAFVLGVLLSACWSFCVYFGALDEIIVDKRDYSRFTSHVRFGLEIAMAIFILGSLAKNAAGVKKLLWVIVILFLLITLWVFSLATGLAVLLLSTFIVAVVFIFRSRFKKIRWFFVALLLSLMFGGYHVVSTAVRDFYANQKVQPLKDIPTTELGNKYRMDDRALKSTEKENGYLIEKHVADKEFEEAWNKRSKIDYNGKDLKGHVLKFTLRRFVASKGLRKDKKAIDALTEEEIRAIEKGVANHLYMKMNGLQVRLHKIIWEIDAYRKGSDVNGHSIMMRWEYLKATLNMIKANFWFGVGTGDIKDSFKQYYIDTGSSLTEHYRRRGHNQYLTYFLTLGIFGFVWILVMLIYPIFKLKRYKNYLYLSFFSVACLSMLTEDTLETQVGIYFFVFFNSLLLLQYNKKTSKA